MNRLFVYGTLRPAVDLPRIRHLVARLRLIGTGRLPGRLVYLGSYPGAVVATTEADTTFIVGEILELTDETILADIDDYEGFDPQRPQAGEYVRGMREVELADGTRFECWVYELREVPPHAVPIAGGDYLAWLAARPTGSP